MGTKHMRANGIGVRFDRHPATGVVVLAIFSDHTVYGSAEVYDCKDGEWGLRGFGREGVHSRCLTHEQIEYIRNQCGEANPDFLAE